MLLLVLLLLLSTCVAWCISCFCDDIFVIVCCVSVLTATHHLSQTQLSCLSLQETINTPPFPPGKTHHPYLEPHTPPPQKTYIIPPGQFGRGRSVEVLVRVTQCKSPATRCHLRGEERGEIYGGREIHTGEIHAGHMAQRHTIMCERHSILYTQNCT